MQSFWNFLGYPAASPLKNSSSTSSTSSSEPKTNDSTLVPASRVEQDDQVLVKLQNELQSMVKSFRNMRQEIMLNSLNSHLTTASNIVVASASTSAGWPWQRDVHKELETAIHKEISDLQFHYALLVIKEKNAESDKNYLELCDDAILLAENLDCFLNKVREIIADAQIREDSAKKFPAKALEILEKIIIGFKPQLGVLLSLLPTNVSYPEKNADLELHDRIQPDLNQVTRMSDQYIVGLLKISKLVHERLSEKLKLAAEMKLSPLSPISTSKGDSGLFGGLDNEVKPPVVENKIVNVVESKSSSLEHKDEEAIIPENFFQEPEKQPDAKKTSAGVTFFSLPAASQKPQGNSKNSHRRSHARRRH